MVRLADNTSKKIVWDMWKTCFGDPDTYMDLYFRDKYRPENTLLYYEGDKAVASLQMLPYRFTFHGVEIPVLYLSGVCTLPEYRKRGYTRALLVEGFNVAVARGVPLMLLVPQENWLIDLYAKYGFEQTFDPGEEELASLKEILAKHGGDLAGAYHAFDGLYRNQDMTVQKSFEDFSSIVAEGALFDYPPKKSLIGMARVIDAARLLALFEEKNPRASFQVEVTDAFLPQNNGVFTVGAGEDTPRLHATIRELARWLMGFHTRELGLPHSSIFPRKHPQMHFMME